MLSRTFAAALLAAAVLTPGGARAQSLGALGQPGNVESSDGSSQPVRPVGPTTIAPTRTIFGGRPPIYGPTTPPQGVQPTHPVTGWPTQTVITIPTRPAGPTTVVTGGYYFGGYCPPNAGVITYPTPYADCGAVPTLLGGPSVVVLPPVAPASVTPSLPYPAAPASVTYNSQTNNYNTFTNAPAIAPQPVTPTHAVSNAPQGPAPGSFQAAFEDIRTCWTHGDVQALHRHLPAATRRIGIYLKRKYAYSLAPKDYLAMTRDAMTRLKTDSFVFKRLRKSANGDITAYGVHVTEPRVTAASEEDATMDNTVPFDQADRLTDNSEPSITTTADARKTIYVSYTLRKRGNIWEIVNSGTASEPLVK